MLRELFGFTEAEANPARGAASGVPLDDYAWNNSVTLTPCRRTCATSRKDRRARMAKLPRKLKELEVLLGAD